MYHRLLLVAVPLLLSGCVALPSVSDDLKNRARVIELPEFMKEYATSGFYLRQRLTPFDRSWIVADGAKLGLNLIALDYGGPGYNYDLIDEVVLSGLYDAFRVYCDQRAGRVQSANALPLPVGVLYKPDRGRVCVGSDRKIVGAIVYGNVVRNYHGKWRTLEYNVLGQADVATFLAAAEMNRKEAKTQTQQRREDHARATTAAMENIQKMEQISDPARQNGYSAWRQQIGVGAACWVGPRRAGEKMMLRAMVIERKGSIVNVQYDGKTNIGYLVKLPRNQEWVNIKDVYPDGEFQVISGKGIYSLTVQPQ